MTEFQPKQVFRCRQFWTVLFFRCNRPKSAHQNRECLFFVGCPGEFVLRQDFPVSMFAFSQKMFVASCSLRGTQRSGSKHSRTRFIVFATDVFLLPKYPSTHWCTEAILHWTLFSKGYRQLNRFHHFPDCTGCGYNGLNPGTNCTNAIHSRQTPDFFKLNKSKPLSLSIAFQNQVITAGNDLIRYYKLKRCSQLW